MSIWHDPLLTLAARRAELVGLKSRDFAAEYDARHPGYSWPTESYSAISVAANAMAVQIESRPDFNVSRRRFHRSHRVGPAYKAARDAVRYAGVRGYGTGFGFHALRELELAVDRAGVLRWERAA